MSCSVSWSSRRRLCHIRRVGQGGLSADQHPAQPGHGQLVDRARTAADILDPRSAGDRYAALADHVYYPAQIVALRSRAGGLDDCHSNGYHLFRLSLFTLRPYSSCFSYNKNWTVPLSIDMKTKMNDHRNEYPNLHQRTLCIICVIASHRSLLLVAILS
jgi:hypothetical protein